MSKKTVRAMKLAGASPVPATPAVAIGSFASTLSTPAGLTEQPTQYCPAELRFAEGSSFQSLPCEEQRRMIDYLSVYRKELRRLIGQGEAGRFAVIKGQNIAHV